MIDPVSIVAAVTGVISAFGAAVSVFTTWKKHKKEKKKAVKETERDLNAGPVAVRQAYDHGHAIAVRSLRDIIKCFQRTTIGFVASQIGLCAARDSVNTTGLEIIDAINALYQRILSAAPVPRPIEKYLGETRKCGPGETTYMEKQHDALIVSHPPPSACWSPIIGDALIIPTGACSSENALTVINQPKSGYLRQVTYRTFDTLLEDLDGIVREPVLPVESVVSTILTALVPKLDVKGSQSALDCLPREISLPPLAAISLGSPKVLQENLVMLSRD
ncbi:hypothetical protein MMC25_006529 [Agyrium rufum]|nr:hypothetical protein [Agyrium rufum]